MCMDSKGSTVAESATQPRGASENYATKGNSYATKGAANFRSRGQSPSSGSGQDNNTSTPSQVSGGGFSSKAEQNVAERIAGLQQQLDMLKADNGDPDLIRQYEEQIRYLQPLAGINAGQQNPIQGRFGKMTMGDLDRIARETDRRNASNKVSNAPDRIISAPSERGFIPST